MDLASSNVVIPVRLWKFKHFCQASKCTEDAREDELAKNKVNTGLQFNTQKIFILDGQSDSSLTLAGFA